MKHMPKFLMSAAMVVTMATSFSAVQAATPPDTLVQAWTIDDIISLDPAEIFEFTASEIAGNTYERLINYDYKDVSKIYGEVAESWTVSPDGKTFTFKIRPNKKFASGNPLTAEDVAFSLQRAVLLDKSPAFILGQFGLTKDNVKDKIKASGNDVTVELDKAYAPTFVLYCMTSTVASVVDKKLVMQNEKDGDLGYGWLKTHYAGSGPFSIRDWKANEVVVLERNPHFEKKTPLARVIYRHIKETATQRLLLEKGDVDVARNLNPEELKALSTNTDIKVASGPKGGVWYLGLNQKNPNLAKPEVRQALKYLVDYSAIADTIMKNQAEVHQAFLPKGFLGAINENQYKLDVAKAKELLAKAGLKDGFTVTMDTRSTADTTGMAQAIQQTFAQAGVKLEIIPGDGKQTLTKYRARQHDIYIGRWGPDYQDPNTNADTFAANDDNSDGAKAKPLAWRNAWDPGPLTTQTRAAVLEKDAEKRAAMYKDLQQAVLDNGPFVIMLQEIEVMASRKNVDGIVIGPSFDTNSVAQAKKN
ncbi:ABC transporter substrate-binding protein [Microvirga brassicacearum]|uniref:ABC transporter substrate-binding protein n=1 Tax=Microvirga brassicacearum TaxID=2580413 RepID=A0A5N3PCX5_9HYPH|nr:ABC transporter substrate-binding protein [Microvirga brassicacearum]KAB0267561.1 ABC transporter substrate-binding protein [Microvirga brassicacearum]